MFNCTPGGNIFLPTTFVGFMCLQVCYPLKNVSLPWKHPSPLIYRLTSSHVVHVFKETHKQAIRFQKMQISLKHVIETDVFQMLFLF